MHYFILGRYVLDNFVLLYLFLLIVTLFSSVYFTIFTQPAFNNVLRSRAISMRGGSSRGIVLGLMTEGQLECWLLKST